MPKENIKCNDVLLQEVPIKIWFFQPLFCNKSWFVGLTLNKKSLLLMLWLIDMCVSSPPWFLSALDWTLCAFLRNNQIIWLLCHVGVYSRAFFNSWSMCTLGDTHIFQWCCHLKPKNLNQKLPQRRFQVNWDMNINAWERKGGKEKRKREGGKRTTLISRWMQLWCVAKNIVSWTLVCMWITWVPLWGPGHCSTSDLLHQCCPIGPLTVSSYEEKYRQQRGANNRLQTQCCNYNYSFTNYQCILFVVVKVGIKSRDLNMGFDYTIVRKMKFFSYSLF